MPRCPTCDKPVTLENGPTAPFCSERCRILDLGRWLDESQALPLPPRRAGFDEDGDEGPEADESRPLVDRDEPPDE